MQTNTIPQSPQPVVTYAAIVGKVLEQYRNQQGRNQAQMATAIGLSQSSYSRLESGDSLINVAQLHKVCAHLGVPPASILTSADQYEMQLRQQGVEVIAEKPSSSAAIAIGLGLLAALILSRG